MPLRQTAIGRVYQRESLSDGSKKPINGRCKSNDHAALGLTELTGGCAMRCAQIVSLRVTCLLLVGLTAIPSKSPAQVSPLSLNDYSRLGNRQTAARKVNDAIYLALGFSNTFLVRTDDGNVVIDTSSPVSAKKHYELLRRVSDAPVRYVILTHGHPDHTGGLRYWMEPQTKLVVQQNYIEFHSYQERLKPYLGRTGAAQFGLDPGVLNAFRVPEKHFEPAITFGDKYEFVLGGTKFELLSAPGETYDHLCVWIPKYKAAFVGDNYYESFPNIYTLRGTKPRWALDYVASLNKILALEPEIVLPSHGEPVVGKEKIVERLTRYRNAILYVHDATVKGMNAGKDVFTLMREVKLPPELEVGEAYGRSIGRCAGFSTDTSAGSISIPRRCMTSRQRPPNRNWFAWRGAQRQWPSGPRPWRPAIRSLRSDWRMRPCWSSQNQSRRSRRSSPRSSRFRKPLAT
jgi:glyoxylase-like metal-dependent hydrolase (beta-lactamase superfamily II)